MRKIFTLFFALIMSMFTFGEVITFTPGTDVSSTTSITKDGITLTATTFNNNSYYQTYKSSTFTAVSTIGNITYVTFRCTAADNAKYGPGNYTNATSGTYTYSGYDGLWSGNDTTFTLTASGNQVRMTSIVVYVNVSELPATEPDTTATVHIANTKETAYTTTEAIALINDKKSILTDTVFVKGNVDEIVSVNSKYKSMTYWITDGENRFEVYGGYWLNKDSVESMDEMPLSVNDSVIVKGLITLYNTTYEFAANNYIVYHKSPSSQWPTDAIDNVQVKMIYKEFRNGQVVIIKNDEVYNVLGQKL